MITALAIMIAVAGYLNFAGTKLSDEELMKVSGQSVVTENGEETAREEDGLIEDYTSASLEISDEDMELAELDAITEETAGQVALQEIESLDTDDTTAAADYLSEDMAQNEVTESDTPGEAVFTSTSSVTSLSSAKLMKEQTRAKNKETLLEIINSTTISEEQKQTAIEGMIQLTDIAEKETAAEILLEAKGFNDVVVSISDSGVDVVVNAETLTDAQCAQIEDIVTRKTGTAPENIIIQCSK
ncbi:MAG: SpoIIIAH-like family protein [Lachnospiraceae bacterium]|nr:SpoIIIAH-like family protein [Lachnospiraceae bacterium]